jgi:hypothetical protein
MAQININITLDNIDANVDAGQLAQMIEQTVKQLSGFNDVSTSVYDNDGSNFSNPIVMQNSLRRIK